MPPRIGTKKRENGGGEFAKLQLHVPWLPYGLRIIKGVMMHYLATDDSSVNGLQSVMHDSKAAPHAFLPGEVPMLRDLIPLPVFILANTR